MFGSQRQRLLREEGWTVDGLRQEIYSLLDPQAPTYTESQVTINVPTSTPPIQISNRNDGSPLMEITRPDGSPYGTISIDGGNFYFTDPNGKRNKMGCNCTQR